MMTKATTKTFYIRVWRSRFVLLSPADAERKQKELIARYFMSAFNRVEHAIVNELMAITGLGFREVVLRALREMLERQSAAPKD